MLREVIEALAIRPKGVYVDCTLGGGGHFREIVKRLGPGGVAVGIDRDPEAIDWNQQRLGDAEARVMLVRERFSHFDKVLAERDLGRVDGMVFDLGVSSRQIDSPERGFSFMQPAPLDMRMDSTGGASAAEMLTGLDEERLTTILGAYGEVRNPRRMAAVLVACSKRKPIRTTGDLRECLEAEYGKPIKFKILAKVFQALRIAVNDELRELQAALDGSIERLALGGRLVVLAYHSLEDRMVKNFMRDAECGCECPKNLPHCQCKGKALLKRITRKALQPEPEEIARNSRARSARLRVAERISGDMGDES